MDLKSRLNLVIMLSMLVIASIGIVYSIITARDSVQEEIHTSYRALNRSLDIGLAQLPSLSEPQPYLQNLITQVRQQRHVRISLLAAASTESNTDHQDASISSVPNWFKRFVQPEPLSSSRTLQLQGQRYQLHIEANPDDEIIEAWGETQGLFYLLALQSLMIWLLCHAILGQALKPLPAILQGLQNIESGDYNQTFPQFSLPEYRQIANAFNHLSSTLHDKTADNRVLTLRSLSLLEDERQTLARELHDELGQSLTGIKGVASSISLAHPASKEAVNTILSICDDLFLVIRSMMRRLRPSILDELGLAASLQDLVDTWQQLNPNIQVTFNHQLPAIPINNDISIHLYRIAQEALNNIVRHAQASAVQITLEMNSNHTTNQMIYLSIHDNGIGFDRNNKALGFGLLGIRERVDSLSGDLQINSQHQHGVHMRISIPVPA